MTIDRPDASLGTSSFCMNATGSQTYHFAEVRAVITDSETICTRPTITRKS